MSSTRFLNIKNFNSNKHTNRKECNPITIPTNGLKFSNMIKEKVRKLNILDSNTAKCNNIQ